MTSVIFYRDNPKINPGYSQKINPGLIFGRKLIQDNQGLIQDNKAGLRL